tara:strand:+ start:1307 stop:1510 length:204 start_codon:yes stop_codon:yes gene_type:complete
MKKVFAERCFRVHGGKELMAQVCGATLAKDMVQASKQQQYENFKSDCTQAFADGALIITTQKIPTHE